MSDFPITAIRSVDLGVTVPARAEAFYTKRGDCASGSLRGSSLFACDGKDHHVLALHPHHSAEILS